MSTASALWHYATLTDVGRMRQNNEDSIAVHPEQGVLVLADGMGGYNAGEVASAMATARIGEAMSQVLAQGEQADWGPDHIDEAITKIGRASCRERV